MEYRTLEYIASFRIHEAFIQAFSDYQVSVAMPPEAFERMLKRKGVVPGISVGAFDGETLVGFVLNGVREWDGRTTIYDLGTGVIPGFRGKGITGKLLDLVEAICKEHGISVYLLEVLQNNENAVSLYKKQGFQVMRTLHCYRLDGKAEGRGRCTGWKLLHPERMCKEQWETVKRFWNDSPSWQNAIDSVCAVADSFCYTLAEKDGEWVGYGIVDKISGDIVQLAVNPKYRRMGAGTEILLDLQEQTESFGMRAINVDGRDGISDAFLKRMGFEVFVKQYEMVKYLSE